MQSVRLGVVGLGRLGLKHAHTLRYNVRGARVAAVCSVDATEVARACAELDLPTAAGYTDYGMMLDSAELDGVVIVSSSAQHAPQIAAALDRGLHVFSEKPLGTTVEQCRQAERAVEAHPAQVFMLGFMRRYDPSYAEAKRRIREGAIGTPFLVRAYGLDPEQFVQGAIRFAATSGGIFLDMMIHDIDLAHWYLESQVKMVHAIGGTYKYPEFAQHGDVDNACAIAQYIGGQMALFYTGRIAPHGYHIETEIVGTEGSIRIDGVPRKNRAVLYGANGVVEECVGAFPERFGEAFTLEFQEFVDCIRESRQPEVTVYDGTRATVVGYAATESLQTGRPVYL